MKDPESFVTEQEISILVGHSIDSIIVYQTALAHSSVFRKSKLHTTSSKVNKNNKNRLKYLGGNLLSYKMSLELFDLFDNSSGYTISRSHSELTSTSTVARYAEHINLTSFITLSRNAFKNGVHKKNETLSDCYKALLGAIHTDISEDECRNFIDDNVTKPFDLYRIQSPDKHPKSRLLEFVQSKDMPQPVYTAVSEKGPSHNKVFTVEVSVDNDTLGRGTGDSKKKAEKRAAQQALQNFEN